MLSLFYLCFLAGIAHAFNLDTENVVKWDGEPGSLFGFSLAMHQQLNPNKRLCKGKPRLSMQKVNPKLGVPAIQETQNKIHSVLLVLGQVIKSPTCKKSPAKETRLLPVRRTAPKSATTCHYISMS